MNIGQFRSTQLDINSYSTPLQVQLFYKDVKKLDNDIEYFKDLCAVLQEDRFTTPNCYYLKFGIKKREDSRQIFNLKLKDNTMLDTQDSEQLINTYTVEKGTGTVYFEVILAPNGEYNEILWQLQRISDDYYIKNVNGNEEYFGRKMVIDGITCSKLENILSILNIGTKKYLTKIGVQSRPFLLMCINREEIRVGRSGIYEINNGIKITSISFVPQENDNFIMDFQY